jgi:hypothetical protein
MAAKLFQNVKYHLPSTLPDETQEDLSALLENHGTTRVQSVYDETMTHIITNSAIFEGWQDVDPEVVAIVSVGVPWCNGIPHVYFDYRSSGSSVR